MTGSLVSETTAARIAELWAGVKSAHTAHIQAENGYDTVRSAIYAHHSTDVAAGIPGVHDELVEAGDNVGDAVGSANEAHRRARAELRAAVVEMLGDTAGQLVDELYNAIDACYAPGMVHFYERITGSHGEALAQAVTAAREKINGLAGTPVLQ